MSTTASAVAATPSASAKVSSKPSSFPTPSFVSPAPAATASKEQLQRTLSGGIKKRQQKRKLDRELQLAASDNNNNNNSVAGSSGLSKAKKHKPSSSSSPGARITAQQQQQMKLKLKARAVASAFATPQRTASDSSSHNNTETKRIKKPLQDISNSSNNNYSSSASTAPVAETSGASSSSPVTQRKSDVPTRKLDFNATPDKLATPSAPKKQRSRGDDATASVGPVTAASSDSSSSSGSDDSSSDSGYSSDEAEVAFDAVTLGNTRVIREAESPYSSASTASTSSVRPVGIEYRFAVSSTVSSIAIAPNGQFLVVGFYNGTIYLYPLNKDATRFRGGVLLDHITARGMYTQLMVRVALPDDGKFIFAGVYRGSTEIRAFEVDSITFPSSSTAAVRARSGNASDDETDDGASHAHAVTHTYSDPKLKGFGAVKSVLRSKTNATEYHLLCGLGIKNVHLWRFFQHARTRTWSWECVFDKQANGISLEYLSFHPSEASQIISKSEHQNIRVWTLEEEFHDDDFTSVTLSKVSHVDVKHTVDTTAVYGDYAYGGSEALAMIDLRTASRLELDLPLSRKEQRAQLDAVAASKQSSARITASMRQRNSRRRGGAAGSDELSGMRHMRTVSQVAGRATSPFTIGMCSDGSVFVHKPESALGMATPLEYVEGYERFFQDPSLSFQAQFSDLTRVNTSGLLSVLPLPVTEKEQWMIVAANQDQLLVRSLKAFLCRNEQVIEQAKVKRGLRNVMRDLGRGGADSSDDASSSSESGGGSSSESDSEDEEILIEKSVLQSLLKPAAKLRELSSASASQSPLAKTPVDSARATPAPSVESHNKAERESKQSASRSATGPKDRKKANATSELAVDAPDARSSLEVLSEQADASTDASAPIAPPPVAAAAAQLFPLVVTTPKRAASRSSSARSNLMTPCAGGVASPVVSVSSLSSGTSNPNTPEPHAKLSQREKQLLVLKDLEWTPPPKAPTASSSAVAKTSRVSSSSSSSSDTAPASTDGVASTKASKSRTKALFAATMDDDDDEENESGASARRETPAPATSSASGSDESALKAKKTPPKAKTSAALSVAPASSAKAAKAQTASGAKKANEPKRSAAAVRKEKAPKKRSKDSLAPPAAVVAAPVTPVAPVLDVDMADPEDDDENGEDDDDDLEMLEENEPVFETTRLVSDGGLLLSASLFQFDATASASASAAGSALSASGAAALSDQARLAMRFAEQTARLKRNFDVEKERIYQQHDCVCASSSSLLLKRRGVEASVAASGPGPKAHWKKALSSDFLKRKQLKRRQKKQIALKLRQLHGRYRAQIHELVAVQKLQANALTARLRFNAMYEQLCPARGDTDGSGSASPIDVAEPLQLETSFPYPSLLSSLAP